MNWMTKMILANMKKRGVRTWLTILGMIIGVISIVLFTAVGIGIKTELLNSVEAFGSLDEIRISCSDFGNKKEQAITDRRLEKLKNEIDGISAIYPCIELSGIASFEKYSGYMDLVGVPEEYLQRLHFLYGGISDKNSISPLVYMPEDAPMLFYNSSGNSSYYEDYDFEDEVKDLTDKKIKLDLSYGMGVDEINLKIAGMVAAKNIECYCDLAKLKRFIKHVDLYEADEYMFGKEWRYTSAIIVAEDVSKVNSIVNELQKKGYQTESNKEYADEIEKETKLAQGLLAIIGTIAFVVAIIGIINTMTTAVYDRIKEIGLLKVLGCEPEELQIMFLLEAGAMGMIGGIIGVIISHLSAHFIINKLVVALLEMKKGTILAVIPWWLSIGAILVSVIIGMIAGYFPSLYVRKLTPIKAMRHD